MLLPTWANPLRIVEKMFMAISSVRFTSGQQWEHHKAAFNWNCWKKLHYQSSSYERAAIYSNTRKENFIIKVKKKKYCNDFKNWHKGQIQFKWEMWTNFRYLREGLFMRLKTFALEGLFRHKVWCFWICSITKEWG